MSANRLIGLVVVLGLISVGIVSLEYLHPQTSRGGVNQAVQTLTNKTKKENNYQPAKEIVAPAGFINTDKITIKELIGKKVILIDFWTYSCINCQRTLPYLTSWYEKYKDQGLEIIGVHTPEFAFEKNIDNVRRAVAQYGITYPVVLDNGYGTWQNYANRYWPRKYLIDIDGYIVYDHIGEGGYEETEKVIQTLLAERKQALGEEGAVASGVVDPLAEMSAQGVNQSPETYFGALRNLNLSNGVANQVGEQRFALPADIKTNSLYLSGRWDVTPEYAEALEDEAEIIFRYRASKVYMVARADKPTRLRILIDGEPISNAMAGDDVIDAVLTIQDDRLYRLVDDPNGFNEHTLEIISEEPGVHVFTFTFG